MEVEKRFKCPHCHERISMLVDCSEDGAQTYVEDCEVCCQPIQLNYEARDQRLVSFDASAAY